VKKKKLMTQDVRPLTRGGTCYITKKLRKTAQQKSDKTTFVYKIRIFFWYFFFYNNLLHMTARTVILSANFNKKKKSRKKEEKEKYLHLHALALGVPRHNPLCQKSPRIRQKKPTNATKEAYVGAYERIPDDT
jgi:hypothetical protein